MNTKRSFNPVDIHLAESMMMEMSRKLIEYAHEQVLVLESMVSDPALNDQSLALAKEVVKNEKGSAMFMDMADQAHAMQYESQNF